MISNGYGFVVYSQWFMTRLLIIFLDFTLFNFADAMFQLVILRDIMCNPSPFEIIGHAFVDANTLML